MSTAVLDRRAEEVKEEERQARRIREREAILTNTTRNMFPFTDTGNSSGSQFVLLCSPPVRPPNRLLDCLIAFSSVARC